MPTRARSVANFIIQAFLTAFEQIKFIWSAFPNVIGAAVVGATNAVIAGVNLMIGGAIAGINALIDAVRSIPGVDQLITTIDPKTGQIPPMADPYSGKIAAELICEHLGIADEPLETLSDRFIRQTLDS